MANGLSWIYEFWQQMSDPRPTHIANTSKDLMDHLLMFCIHFAHINQSLKI